MNRFLRKEWEEWEPTTESCLRARDRAWERHFAGEVPIRARTKLWWPLAVAAALMAVVWTLLPPEPPVLPQQAVLTELPLAELGPAVVFPLPPITLAEQPRRPIEAVSTAPRETPARDGKPVDRVVLDFHLPESGVRMIWIQDRNFGPARGALDK